MKIITGARNSGKTTELVKLSAETGAYIVTRDHNSARQLIDIAEHLGLHIPFPLTWSEFYHNQYDGRRIRILFDDVDSFLQSLASAPILAVTLSIEEDLEKKVIELPENKWKQ